MQHVDDGVYGRIRSMPLPTALAAVEALVNGDYGHQFKDYSGLLRAKNPPAWLMGIISRALAQGGGA